MNPQFSIQIDQPNTFSECFRYNEIFLNFPIVIKQTSNGFLPTETSYDSNASSKTLFPNPQWTLCHLTEICIFIKVFLKKLWNMKTIF